jgi:PleD family two-component response regulator
MHSSWFAHHWPWLAGSLAALAAAGAHVLRLRARLRSLERRFQAVFAELEVARRRLRDVAALDVLTGVASRRAFMDVLSEGLARALRWCEPIVHRL